MKIFLSHPSEERDVAERDLPLGFVRTCLAPLLKDVRVLVFLRPVQVPPLSPLVVHWMGDDERFHYKIDIVRLWELPPEQVLATDTYALWPLVGLMAGASIETMIETAERVIAAPIPRGEQSEITGTLVLLAGVNLPLDAIIEAIRRQPMLDEIFEESSVAQYLMEKGQEEGRRQTARDMARMALESRYGTLAEDLLAALNAADEAALRDVVAHIGTDSLEQARARLGLG